MLLFFGGGGQWWPQEPNDWSRCLQRVHCSLKAISNPRRAGAKLSDGLGAARKASQYSNSEVSVVRLADKSMEVTGCLWLIVTVITVTVSEFPSTMPSHRKHMQY